MNLTKEDAGIMAKFLVRKYDENQQTKEMKLSSQI